MIPPDSVLNNYDETNIGRNSASGMVELSDNNLNANISDDQDYEQNIGAEDLMQNLFYLKDEQPQRNCYSSNVGKIIHKSMQYKCVDSTGPNNHIQVDLIDIIQNAVELNEHKKYRSLIYFKVSSNESATPTGITDNTENKIRDLASAQEYDSFEQMYNKVTEKLV